MDECQVSLTGFVATQPETKTFDSGASHVKMRVAWTERRRDRVTGEWVDGNTSYVTVYCWRKIGTNVAVSLRTGDPVLVKGRLIVRTYEDGAGVRRTIVDVDANSIGHDLSRGVSKFFRVRPPTGMTASEYEAAKAAGRLPSSAAQAVDNAGDGPPGSGNGAGAGQGLRFAGGLELPAANGMPGAGDLAAADDDPEGWARDADDEDLGAEAPEPGAADGPADGAADGAADGTEHEPEGEAAVVAH